MPQAQTPSSVSIGKKPMAYPAQQQQQQQQPRSARAASKAPLAYQHQQQQQQHRNPSPTSKGKPSPNKIWSTSTTEERERIKDFWLGLGEEERRNLVKIEKDTVLRKMKEQQKHSCSCAVCGRKRCVPSRPLFVSFPLLCTKFLVAMPLKKNSRYCTMLITKS